MQKLRGVRRTGNGEQDAISYRGFKEDLSVNVTFKERFEEKRNINN